MARDSPILFRDAYIVDRATFNNDPVYSNADWSFVKGRAMPWEKLAIWPSPIVRRATESAGKGDGVDLLDLSADTKVTAYINAQGKIDLRAWGKIGNGDMTQTDHELFETAEQVALAKPSVTPFFVSAIRTPGSQIKLTEWDGFLGEGVSALAGTGTDVAITTSPHMPGLVTATRTLTGNLQIKGWDYSWGFSIDLGDTVDAGAISDVAIATGSEFRRGRHRRAYGNRPTRSRKLVGEPR